MIVQDIGQALYEKVVYDENGQLLSGTLMDYALPNASMLPTFVTDFIESPSSYNLLGAERNGPAWISSKGFGKPVIRLRQLDFFELMMYCIICIQHFYKQRVEKL